MSKDFGGWLKYKHGECSKKYNKLDEKHRTNQITDNEWSDSVRKCEIQLTDLYKTLKTVLMIETWSGNYECMIREMELREHNRPHGTTDMRLEAKERCILKCSIVLYEQYLQKKIYIN